MNNTEDNKEEKTDAFVENVKHKEVYWKFIEWSSMNPFEQAAELGLNFEADGDTGLPKERPTLKHFAARHKVHRNTLLNWQNRPDYQREVYERSKERGISRYQMKMGNALEALYRRCIRYGMAKDVELLLNYAEGWHRNLKVKEVERLAMDDLRRTITYLPEEKQEYYFKVFEKLYLDLRAAGAAVSNESSFSSKTD